MDDSQDPGSSYLYIFYSFDPPNSCCLAHCSEKEDINVRSGNLKVKNMIDAFGVK